MSRVRGWLVRLRELVRAGRSDRDLRTEIDAHLDEAIDDYRRRGLAPDEARRAALIDFGGVAQAEESYRTARGRFFPDVARDLRYGWRSLGRDRGFAAIAILSLAVGIGANTVLFSVVNAMALRPRPVASPDELVELYTGDRRQPYETISYPSYLELRDRHDVFTGLAAYGIRRFTLTGGDQAEHVWGEVVSANYFDVLGIVPAHGRLFAAADPSFAGGNTTAVLGHSLWRRRFNADPDVVGRTVSINGQTLTVTGVLPPAFTGMMRVLAADVWIPASALPLLEPDRTRILDSRGSRWLTMVGRLRRDVSIEQVQARFDVLSREMQANYPGEWRSQQPESNTVRELFVTVLAERDTRIHPTAREDAWVVAAALFAIVNVLLLIACINLTGMLLARAIARRREMAIRLALGANRRRLVRQLITESLLVSFLAGALGVLLALWGLDAVVASMPVLPEGIRIGLDLQLDWRVLLYSTVCATVVGVLFGLAPAWRSARSDVSPVLRSESIATTGGLRQSRGRMALVVVQVAASMLLLIGAGLVVRSLEKARPSRLGFTSTDMLVAPLRLETVRYDRAGSQAFYRDLAARVSALPGVEHVSFVEALPGGVTGRARRRTEIEGYVPAPGEDLQIDATLAGPRYFTHLRVPVVQGRDFDERDRDGSPCVAIVNEVFARRYFGGTDGVVGRHLAGFEGPSETREWCAIVGLIRDDAWQTLQPAPRPFFALALLQTYRTWMMMVVSTTGEPAGHVAPVRRAVRALDPTIPVTDVQTLDDFFSVSLYPYRVLGFVMAGCGALALALAIIGVYGIVSYSAARRTREMGIRMALGALKHDVLRTVVGEGMAVVTLGLAIGLIVGVLITSVAGSLFAEVLFGVSATDAVTFGVVTLLMAGVAAIACYIPARRAANVEGAVGLFHRND